MHNHITLLTECIIKLYSTAYHNQYPLYVIYFLFFHITQKKENEDILHLHIFNII